MPRIAPLNRSDLAEAEPLLAHFEAVMGFVPNSLLTMGRWPALLNAACELARTVFGPPGGRLDQTKFLVAHVVSRVAGCRYCSAHTAATGAERGVPAAKIEAAFAFESSPLFDDAERAALRLAVAAAQTPNLATDEDFADLKRHYTDEEILELVAMIALYGFLNRWNDTLATELESVPAAFGHRHLSAGGWTPGKHAAGKGRAS